MAFHGDLSSFPLPELLQWLDSSRKTGALHLSWEGSERTLFLLSGQVVATSAPGLPELLARKLEQGRIASGQLVLTLLQSLTEQPNTDHNLLLRHIASVAQEELYAAIADLTQAQTGQFHWSEDADRGGEQWAPVELSLRHLLFEALRWVDEMADVDAALPSDGLMVKAKVKPAADAPVLHRILLTVCERPQSLGHLRLTLGVSRAAVSRWVFDLLRVGRVEVDGVPPLKPDPITEALMQGASLVRGGHYEAAELICATLLTSDPADRRVREFAHMVEREHVASLYRELPPLSVPVAVLDPERLAKLRPEERHLASMVNGQWDVSTLVLANPQREVDTLRLLRRLSSLGLVSFDGT